MEPERDDPIIDACLEELLGGVTPPDLSERILRALDEGQVPAAYPHLMPPEYEYAGPGEGLAAAANGTNRASSNGSSDRRVAAASVAAGAAAVTLPVRRSWLLGREARNLLWGVTAAGVIAAVGFWVGRNSLSVEDRSDQPNVVERSDTEKKYKKNDSQANNASPAVVNNGGPVVNNGGHEKPLPKSSDRRDRTDVASARGKPDGPDFGSGEPNLPAPSAVTTPRPTTAANNSDVIAFVNAQIAEGWREHRLTASPQATDAEWCRRTYLRILGRIPTVAELLRFLDDAAQSKHVALVDRLLDSPAYRDSYARNWTSFWSNVLIGRSGGMQSDSKISRSGMRQYLREALLENRPYDRMVHELVSATGSNRPGTPGFNGAVNFHLGNMQDKAVTATAKTAQVFLGLQVQCTQCHNHPFNDALQNRFWELNAFFRQTQVVSAGGKGGRHYRLVNRDFSGEGKTATPQQAEIYYEGRNGKLQAVYPRFIDGTEIAKSGFVSTVDRRGELATLISSSEWMPRAAVNRLWAHFFGFGLTAQLDDMGPHAEISHPQLLDRLSKEFVASGYDLKRLMRWLALSDAFSLSSRQLAENKSDDPLLGVAWFSRYYTRQMRPEELYESLMTATEFDQARMSYAALDDAKTNWLQQFTIDLNTDECNEASTFDGTVGQTLMMMNGRSLERIAGGEKHRLIERLVADRNMSPETKLQYLYQAALSRKARPREIRMANDQLRQRGDMTETLQDIWWVLLNSNEFILDH